MSTENKEKLNYFSVWQRVEEVAGDATKKQIAAMAGVSPAAVTNWQTDGKIPLEPLFRFALANGVSIHWLLTGEGEKMVSKPSEPEKDLVFAFVMKRGATKPEVIALEPSIVAAIRAKVAEKGER